ncbi:MAG TPA: hypothetical protein DDZ40_02195 [Deltaproteobacteria bacterium]|nr:hypothetical protein [Deltaproteobacteria bacterium]
MRRFEKTLVFVSGAVMDFSWLYAWTIFAMIAAGREGFPFADAAVMFAAAAVLTRISTGRGLRVIAIGLLQATGLVSAALRTIYIMSGTTGAFFNTQWLMEFFGARHSAMEWFALVAALFWTSAIWLGGAFFAARPKTHEKICSRFDLGLAAFFSILLIKLALVVKGNPSTGDNLTGLLACVFFFFGLVAMGMTRANGAHSPGLVSGRRRLGVVMGFISAVLLCVMSVAVFFQQPLARAAGTGYGLLKGGTSSLGSIFLWFIKLLYMPRQAKMRDGPSGSSGSSIGSFFESDNAQWVEVVSKVLAWLFGTFLGLTILVVTAVAVFYVVRWLFSRTARDHSDVKRRSLSDLVRRLRDLIALFAGKARRFLGGYTTAADFYRALTIWSRRSGVQPDPSETPSEFSCRLAGIFPSLKHEIESIAGAFNREFYGEATLGRDEIDFIRLSWRKLRNPSSWPVRMKTRVFGTITSPG